MRFLVPHNHPLCVGIVLLSLWVQPVGAVRARQLGLSSHSPAEEARQLRSVIAETLLRTCSDQETVKQVMDRLEILGKDPTASLDLDALRKTIADIQREVDGLRTQKSQVESVLVKSRQDADAAQQLLKELEHETVSKALGVLGDNNLGLSARDPVDLLSQQVGGSATRLQLGGQDVIVTVFGYFIYDHELDLSKRDRVFRLGFQPYVFAQGGSVGQAVNAYASKAQLSLETGLDIQAPAVSITSTSRSKQALALASPLEWLWDVKQSFWTSQSEADGTISVRIESPDRSQAAPAILIKVKCRPWWSVFTDLWEAVCSSWKIIVPLGIAIGITWKKGLPAGMRWLWRLVARKSVGSDAH